MSGTVSRHEMMSRPFEPVAGGTNEPQNSHSLSYIAFYLGEINQKLGRLVEAVDGGKLTAGVGPGPSARRKT
jgi:hypothetical protein